MVLVADLTLVLATALAGGLLARRVGQPLIVGYIVAGVVVGPATGGLTVIDAHGIEQIAEVGVALLLFSLGLELSFRELAPVRAVATAGAALQMALTAALGVVLATALGWTWQPALWFGAIISLSSTMVVLKTLQVQGRLGTLSSRVMLGMLVAQDLAVVPLMIVLPELGRPGAGVRPVMLATARATALLAIIVLASTRIVPRLMAFAARWNSRELFLLSTTTVAIGVGYLTWLSGLSLAIGAFVAGLAVNESEYSRQALSEITPLRDLFGMLFFVSVGMLLDPALAWRQIGTLGVVAAVTVVGKAAIVAGVVRLFGYRQVVPLAAGLTLFQVGEFAFVLARAGRSAGALGPHAYAIALNTAIATMALTPALSGLTPWIYERFGRRAAGGLQSITLPPSALTDHVIVAGAGRVGRTTADALSRVGIASVLIELDDRRVQHARAAGLQVLYGDASQPVVLEAAGIARARTLLVTAPAFTDVRAIAMAARQLRPDIAVIARADSAEAVRDLYAMGVSEVASPEFEAAIEMTRQALAQLDVPASEILRIADDIRRERYGQPASAVRADRGHGA
jgi:CPA2 family monovalent cation:H+ antiporter-2